MLEWRLLVAWRVDGWHIDLVFSGSVQSAASKHGQTVKRSLARPLSRGPRPHAPRTVRELGDLPDAQRRGSEAIPDPSVRPVWVESWASAGKRAFLVALFCHQIFGWMRDMGRREARGCVQDRAPHWNARASGGRIGHIDSNIMRRPTGWKPVASLS